MKLVIRFVVSVLLLLSVAACNQERLSKTAGKTETTDKPAAKTGAICNTTNSTNSENQVSVTVTKTVDGNTMKAVYNGKEETVRYLLIDLPKANKLGTCDQPYATDAFKRNKQLLHSGNVTLEFELGKSQTDENGQLLAYVFVNGTSIQEILLKEGLARVSKTEENRHYKYLIPYISYETSAKSKQLNIWSNAGYVKDIGFKQCGESSSNTTN